MNLKGLDEAGRRLDEWQAGLRDGVGERMQAVAAALEGWAKTEHGWVSRSGRTEASITAFLDEEQVTAGRLVVVLQADQDAALWLEMAHSGKWAWMWAVAERHREEILGILGPS